MGRNAQFFGHAFFVPKCRKMQEYGGGFVVKLLKALNNNVALVLDDKRMESVVMGRGVAFNVKVGQHINSSLVEKHFVLNG